MTQKIKHWGKRYSPFAESICSTSGCMNEGSDFENGRVKCSRCLRGSLRLEVRGAEPQEPTLRTVRRLGHAS